VNSYDTHRLLHLGVECGVGDAVRERLMRSYTAEGADLGERQTLARLAAEAIGNENSRAAPGRVEGTAYSSMRTVISTITLSPAEMPCGLRTAFLRGSR
jgi:hypothetical protein